MSAPRPFRILLVEDEPVIRELVRHMLTDGTVEVECADDGADGLARARARPFDLVLLDVVLPRIDGIALCRMLKADLSTASIPLYMLTGRARQADIDAATRAGADGYIRKPFRGVELMALVEKLKAAAARPSVA